MTTTRVSVHSRGVHFQLHGPTDGVPLFLGFPLMASHAEIFGEGGWHTLRGYLDALTDRYLVLLADYPSIGQSASIPTDQLTADRVCEDLLGVADAAGFDRFAWWGYSWGGAVGLQLASRSDRISALVCGGWPPLGAPYAEVCRAARQAAPAPPPATLAVLREPGQYAQWVTFYESLEGWDESAAVARITCPRMVFVGSEGDTTAGHGSPLSIASAVRAHSAELMSMGWSVRQIEGRDHSVGLDPVTVVPLVRPFLDAVL